MKSVWGEGDATLIELGRVVRPHGVRGEVKVLPLTDWPERFKKIHSLFLEIDKGTGMWVDIEKVRFQGKWVLIKFCTVTDRVEADNLRGASLKVKEEDCKDLPENVFHTYDVVGSEVITEAGETIGKVVDVLPLPAQDIFVVRKGNKEIMIPAVDAFIKNVDLTLKQIIISPIEGLLEDYEN
jgi:16S rRNA processing protein RimM